MLIDAAVQSQAFDFSELLTSFIYVFLFLCTMCYRQAKAIVSRREGGLFCRARGYTCTKILERKKRSDTTCGTNIRFPFRLMQSHRRIPIEVGQYVWEKLLPPSSERKRILQIKSVVAEEGRTKRNSPRDFKAQVDFHGSMYWSKLKGRFVPLTHPQCTITLSTGRPSLRRALSVFTL